MATWVPITISLIALAFSAYVYLATRRSSKLAYFGSMISEILQINLRHPQFDDPQFTNTYPDIDEALRREYEIYATMVWNCIGLLSVEYRDRLDRCPFVGVVEYWSSLHEKWIRESSRRHQYHGLGISIPSLTDRNVDFGKSLFPEVHKRWARATMLDTLFYLYYYHVLAPFLFPFSAKYREEAREYWRRGA